MVGHMKLGFPIELLEPEMSILCLFSAAFFGNNDIQFIHEAGCRDVILLDNDEIKLRATARRFNYDFRVTDIYEWLKSSPIEVYDIVVSDQWSNQDQLIHVDYFQQIKLMARKYMILGCTEMWLQGDRPEGEYYKRSNYNGGVYWRVLCNSI